MAWTHRRLLTEQLGTLMSGALGGVLHTNTLSRRRLRTIYQNLCWAFGYNPAAILAVAARLLDPIVAGAVMAFSSVSVVINSHAAGATVAPRVRRHAGLRTQPGVRRP